MNKYNLSNNQIQVLLTGTFGDGCIILNKSNTSNYSTNCIHKPYMDYKHQLLEDLQTGEIRGNINMGFKQNMIYHCRSKASNNITLLHQESLETKLSLLDELGLALWFYDDGSLHKSNYYYNLNTHAFPEEVQRDLFIPYFEKLGTKPVILKDNKKDGRSFSYLYFAKCNGASFVANILKKYPVDCFSYKRWDSEYLRRYDKIQKQITENNLPIPSRTIAHIISGRSAKMAEKYKLDVI